MRKVIWTIALVAAIGHGPAQAGTVTVDFSISGDPTMGLSGTVTGELIGLNPNGTSGTTDVILTSFPAGLNAPSAAPIDIASWTKFDNSFTLSNGIITSGSFLAFKGNDLLYINDMNGDPTGPAPINGLTFSGGPPAVENEEGFTGVTFSSPAPTPVPEPASLVMFGFGVLALGWLSRRCA